MTTVKTIALNRCTFVNKGMSLLSTFIIAFLPRSKHLLISWLQALSPVILEPTKIKSVPVSTFFPFYFQSSEGIRCYDLSFPNVEFQARFYSSLSPSSRGSLVPLCFLPLEWYNTYLRLLTLFLTSLIPACDSSSLAFTVMYSVYKLNKQRDNIQLWCTHFPILN